MTMPLMAQTEIVCEKDGFTLKKANDSLYWINDFRLPYPVYQFQTGDVDGNGSIDAMVGVIKTTRFYKDKSRRVFIFKQINKKARPMWMGSKLGGILEDFRFKDGVVRALERTTDGQYVVTEYRWAHFGMGFERFLAKNVGRDAAMQIFIQD